ncbi:class I SAM-dependent methyltransferase [Alkaliphilus peptidifermentans]|uniref:Methyltransferase domain-containing protein n=1 Tax=Alkaliphilus peptidifermentans DSM 18978 TaxID=1120976 RepID=A0A1G5BPQ7_9FIRM|nr:class I SAM-dependent methyltransferase [Alkaliphilus peptidifermentans]SCX92067.1 Methyltransferase domain-containing protein [Alkaliphilus peptidifermentans DSM 18978]
MEKYFFEAFEGLDRMGPGSKASTLKAISMFHSSKEQIEILDIGCGNGIHTMLLAQEFPNAIITAIDNNVTFIENLNNTAREHGLSDRVIGKCISMFEMPFEDNSFDLIWSEGAIYIAGFENGLHDWKRFLRDDGYLICSEISWVVNNPSEEIYNFWSNDYPQIDTVENKINQIKKAGYSYKTHFIAPVTDWTDNYYTPLQASINSMLQKYADNEVAKQTINLLQTEINLYHKYYSEYSYVFYIMSK